MELMDRSCPITIYRWFLGVSPHSILSCTSEICEPVSKSEKPSLSSARPQLIDGARRVGEKKERRAGDLLC